MPLNISFLTGLFLEGGGASGKMVEMNVGQVLNHICENLWNVAEFLTRL